MPCLHRGATSQQITYVGLIEYLDAEEEECSMISMFVDDLVGPVNVWACIQGDAYSLFNRRRTCSLTRFTWRVLTALLKQSANVVASCGSPCRVQVVPQARLGGVVEAKLNNSF